MNATRDQQLLPPDDSLSPIDSGAKLLAELRSIHRPLSREALTHFTARVRLTAKDFADSISFAPFEVRIHEVYLSEHVEVNLLCWRPGQRSPVHDHRGSGCCVVVLEGVLTNSDFRLGAEGVPQPTRERQIVAGEMLSRHDRQIHRCTNRQPTTNLISLHFYSPPLRPMAERTLGDAQ